MGQSVNMAARDEVDVCESWEDMDDIRLELMTSSATRGCSMVEESPAPQPAIRILKRPTGVSDGRLAGGPARPVKTLQQRQQEYAEARLRILGEARSPEDVLEEKLTIIQEKFQSNTLNETKVKPTLNNENSKPRGKKLLTRLPPGVPTVYPSPPPPGVLVIRTPRGPDGTKGFSKR